MILCSVLCIGLISSANEFGYNYLESGESVSDGGNYSINVNNSNFLQGLTPQQVADLFTEVDPNYFSNPRNYINVSEGMDYTNIAMTNISETFEENLTIDGNLEVDDGIKSTNIIEIFGSYFLKWLDNAGTNTYAYIMASVTEFKIASVSETDMNFYYGNLGSHLGASMDGETGDWSFTKDINVDGVDSYFNSSLLIDGDMAEGNATLYINSDMNEYSCIELTEGSPTHGFTICNDGSGTNRLVFADYSTGSEWFWINRDDGTINFLNDTIFTTVNVTTINTDGNITADTYFGDGSQLTGIGGSGEDNIWTNNSDEVYLKSNYPQDVNITGEYKDDSTTTKFYFDSGGVMVIEG